MAHPKSNTEHHQTRLIISLLCVAFLFSCTAYAGGEPKTMLINSDSSVEKYRVAGEAFRQAMPHPVLEISLNEERWGEPAVRRFMADQDPDLVYCIGTRAYTLASNYGKKKKIVFSSILNWLRLPLTPQTYGVSNELPAEMQITMFRYIFPDVGKIGVLYGKEYNEKWFRKAKAEAGDMGVDVIGKAVSGKPEIISELRDVLDRTDAFWLIPDPMIMSEKKVLFKVLNICDTAKKPIFSYHEVFANYGAVLIVSADNSTIGRQAAGIALEVLEGAEMEEKVQFPAGTRMILNMKKVKEYGLKYSKDALGSVNHIIE